VSIMNDSLPLIKSFFQGVSISGSSKSMVTRFMISILTRHGRNSSMHAASVCQDKPLHRAQPGRFLKRARFLAMDILDQLRFKLLESEIWAGDYILIVDSTMVSQQGKTVENTYSTGNRKRRPQKGRRYGKYKHSRRSCHCFVFGLLLTPDGLRIPFVKPCHSLEYAKQKKIKHRTQAQLAAHMINELPVPDRCSVTVLGDTAFDAKIVRQACRQRGYVWIFPCNANRVFAGRRKERPRVSSRIEQLSDHRFKTIRLTPGSGDHVAKRRLSKYRVGSKSKSRTYYVHSEKREVHSVGHVRLVYSSTKPIKKKAQRETTKILLTNATDKSVRQIVELYCIRWQIELFFKELKSVLGMHQYEYKRFEAVESWIAMVAITFVYLEWIRFRKLADRRLRSQTRDVWRPQRCYGIRQAVLVGIQIRQHQWISKRIKTKSGLKTIEKTITSLLAHEYRCSV